MYTRSEMRHQQWKGSQEENSQRCKESNASLFASECDSVDRLVSTEYAYVDQYSNFLRALDQKALTEYLFWQSVDQK